MIYLFLSILSSTLIAVVFKWVEIKKAHTFQAIVINYAIAFIPGLILSRNQHVNQPLISGDWLLFALLIGFLFIVMFYIIGISTQKAGMAVTTISGRLAVVIPILFSIIKYQEFVSWLKILGLFLALVSLVLSVYKPVHLRTKYFFLPVIIFFGAGLIDSLVKYVQDEFLQNGLLSVFTMVLFGTSFLMGLAIWLIGPVRKIKVKKNTVILGFLLGVVNFGSIFFFVSALNSLNLSSSSVFGINHISIVILTALFAWMAFKEKLSIVNVAGLISSIIAIFILSKF